MQTQKIRILLPLSLFIITTSCSYREPLEHHELLVPPFIQTENPELYKIFQPEKESN